NPKPGTHGYHRSGRIAKMVTYRASNDLGADGATDCLTSSKGRVRLSRTKIRLRRHHILERLDLRRAGEQVAQYDGGGPGDCAANGFDAATSSGVIAGRGCGFHLPDPE